MQTINPELLYSQIDVFPTSQNKHLDEPKHQPSHSLESSNQLCSLMQELVSTQDRQAMLLEQLVAFMAHNQKQRIMELGLWKLSNPELSEYCKKAAKKLERIHNDLLSAITGEIESNSDNFFDNEYKLGEFLDKYSHRFFQLDTMFQMLQQLGNAPDIKIQTIEK